MQREFMIIIFFELFAAVSVGIGTVLIGVAAVISAGSSRKPKN